MPAAPAAAPPACREFLQDKLAGLLQVTIHGTSSMPTPDSWLAVSRPYVSLAVGDSTHTAQLVQVDPQGAAGLQTCHLFVR